MTIETLPIFTQLRIIVVITEKSVLLKPFISSGMTHTVWLTPERDDSFRIDFPNIHIRVRNILSNLGRTCLFPLSVKKMR